jgi:hypothetical protein
VQTFTRFWVDRTLSASAVSSPAFSPNGDGQLDTVRLSFTLLNPARIEVRVFARNQVVATLLEQDLQLGPQRLTWDGGGLPDGRYTVAVSAADSLRVVRQTVPVQIDRRPPALKLVSFSSLTFRVSEPGRLVLAVNGRWRQAAVRRAGLVHIRYKGTVRGLTAYAVDLARNKSRTLKARR